MRFEDNQYFSVWVYILLLLSDLFAVGAVIAVSTEEPKVLWVLPVMVLFLWWVWDLMYLHLRVDNTEVYAQLGRVIPIFWKRFPLGDISELRVVQYHPLRDGGGWGWRIGRFEEDRCWFYNAKGNRGVFFKTPERNYILGSQNPEALLAAIADAQKRNA